ncbi:hypothetical protein B1R32_13122 [Abditibacterium utsteinense]|uniref:Uncharacterized protein n=2 Tax=Abditibacterium utsteinense TaxID=1960156 RepID=A0A2S8SP00_9BACT|nr:hypothetical protein B1R32_13122 [Abditibacterium utsteinense]
MWQYKLVNSPKQSGPPAKELQTSLANRAIFETIAPTDERIKSASSAIDLSRAKSLLGQKGAFSGTVFNVRSSTKNSKVVLDFAAQRETAMRAFITARSFSKFPDLEKLLGKKVLIYGIFAPHEGRVEVEMTELGQLKIIE